MGQNPGGYGFPPAGPPPGPYGPPSQGAPGFAPQQAPGYAPPPQYVIAVPQKSPGVAVALELLPGFFFQTFGIGHMYAGNVGVGLAFMFGYWAVTFVNFLLCIIVVGFFTWPVCFLVAAILSPILAAGAAGKFNMRLMSGRPM